MLADSLANDALNQKELILMFCRICKTVRAKGPLCEIHRAFDPTIDIEKCRFYQPQIHTYKLQL
jgi:hypothetical protein